MSNQRPPSSPLASLPPTLFPLAVPRPANRRLWLGLAHWLAAGRGGARGAGCRAKREARERAGSVKVWEGERRGAARRCARAVSPALWGALRDGAGRRGWGAVGPRSATQRAREGACGGSGGLKLWRLGRGSSLSSQASSGGDGDGDWARATRSWPRQLRAGQGWADLRPFGEKGSLSSSLSPCRPPPGRDGVGGGWWWSRRSRSRRLHGVLRGEEGPGPSLLRSGSVRLSPGERRPEAIASRRSQLPRCSLLW